MRECPFCGYDEAWIKNKNHQFLVQCHVCEATGPGSNSPEGAEEKWDGILSELEGPEFKKALHEEATGGVSAPMTTLNNTSGVGNAQPAQMAAMSGAQQYDAKAIGSGDKWGAEPNKKKKKTKSKSIKHKIDSVEQYSRKIKTNGLTR